MRQGHYEYLPFTETDPDKGTKTISGLMEGLPAQSLQKLTPIRGRKQVFMKINKKKERLSLQKLTPIRGRKL